ncbi:MAG: AraC family transcriptional regulator [Eubacteriales bacterium]|nr:AraC family transcriptional regulator [Eubacteriales bacterium]MDD4327822.1 AraC family transcriptional regulator [Eubacteriales bacterium]MDD4717636.1 AraC family transcriptional regulator [Eubacteriales bacterium]NCU25978.1 AraC family transcriptional regulator [Candidatus Nomurabacteria bacterium]
MLANLTTKTFSKFGSVENDGFDAAVSRLGISFTRRFAVTDKTVRRLFINEDSDTILDIDEGTAILFAGKTPAELETFLLDKTVRIDPEIYYYITPLINTAEISIGYSGTPSVTLTDPHERPEGITPSIDPYLVRTLLYHEKEPNFRFKGESHPFWELTFVDLGDMCNLVEEKEYELKQGDLMLCLPDQFHSQYSRSGKAVRYLTVSFEMRFSDPGIFDGTVFECDEYMRNLMAAIMTEARGSRIYSEDLILCYLKELIISLLRVNKIESSLKMSHPAVRRSMENKIAEQAKAYVADKLCEHMTVLDVARSIPVSESYMSKVFRKAEGVSLNNYIIERKLEKAKELLAAGDRSVTEIAEYLGYSNVHYFSAQFKRVYGISPKAFTGTIMV